VSEIANWGRWLVAAYLAVDGALSVKIGIDHGDGILESLIGAAIWFAFLYGVLAGSRLAYIFLVAGAILWPPLMAYLMISGKADEFGFRPLALRSILGYAAECFLLVWLLLPSVRVAYGLKEKAA
jgi:hypothetical protein